MKTNIMQIFFFPAFSECTSAARFGGGGNMI